MTKLSDATLYLVAPGEFGSEDLAAAIEGGVGIVQIRMKDAEAAAVLLQGARFKEVCAAGGVPLIVNDRPDIALALHADGAHLGQDDLPAAVARGILGPHALIGRSTHSPEDIERAIAEHDDGLCDYIAVGPVHETPTKPGRPAVGYDLVSFAANKVSFPWFAIGGIDDSNVGEVRGAGAVRIVVARAIAQAPDPGAAAARLARALA
jgi:thiamine-phosphate pyrophosphorylase